MEDWVRDRVEKALKTGVTGPNRMKPPEELEAIRPHIQGWKTYVLRVPDEDSNGELSDYVDIQAVDEDTAIRYFHAGFFLTDAPYEIVRREVNETIIDASGPMKPGLDP